MEQVWKSIKGFEELYEVSNMGRVRSKKRITKQESRNGSLYNHTYTGKLLTPGKDKVGYRSVSLCRDGTVNRKLVHRLVAEAFIPNPTNKPQVNHKDLDKGNNKVNNLEWATIDENHKHARTNGMARIGEKHGGAKLTKKEVLKIREIASNRGHFYGRKELAEKYGVSEDTIREVVNRKTWKHLPQKSLAAV